MADELPELSVTKTGPFGGRWPVLGSEGGPTNNALATGRQLLIRWSAVRIRHDLPKFKGLATRWSFSFQNVEKTYGCKSRFVYAAASMRPAATARCSVPNFAYRSTMTPDFHPPKSLARTIDVH